MTPWCKFYTKLRITGWKLALSAQFFVCLFCFPKCHTTMWHLSLKSQNKSFNFVQSVTHLVWYILSCLYDNLMCAWWLRVWKALCPITSVQQISTCPWQRWSGSFKRHCGSEPANRAQTSQVEQAEINEHHKTSLFNMKWHWMNIPPVKMLHNVFK